MSSRTLAAAAPRLFLEIGAAAAGVVAINTMWEKRQLEMIRGRNLKRIKCQKKREENIFRRKRVFSVKLRHQIIDSVF